MAIVMALFALLLGIGMYASLTKAAARLYRRTTLSWKSAFVFGAIAMLFGVAGTLLSQALSAAVPPLAVLLIGFALTVASGAGFLGTRATNASGQAIGVKNAAALCAIVVAIAFALGVVLAVVIPALAPK